MNLIPAVKKDNALLEEMDACLDEKASFNLWWLGQSGFLVQWNGRRLLIDPYLSDSLTVKYAATSKPHIRLSERVIEPSLLTKITVVTSSHNHTDHLDAETLTPLFANNPAAAFLIPEANRDFVTERVKRADDFPIGINDKKSVTIEGFTFHGIPAKHNEIDRDSKGNPIYMGYVIEFGNWTIYHSGDTLWYSDMADLLRPFKIDLALLPINGDDPSRGVAGNLNFTEAAQLAKAVKARCVIPCHYNMFSFNSANVDDFEKAAQSIDQPHCILKHGEKWSSSFFEAVQSVS
ncbi:MAG: MBL fold metallo-hydrolase [Chitinophagaceae bacterium]|nr:MBL fold metallo-hydrolase [Chitinophagaceae bacterium]